MLKKISIATALLLAVLFTALVANTLSTSSAQIVVPVVTSERIDALAAANRLAGAVQLRTITDEDGSHRDAAEFVKLHAYLQRQFPLTHAALRREVIGDAALLYTWVGTDPSAPAVMLMAHQDVVPIAPGTEDAWTVDPFSGAIQDGFVWGRGAWDDKGNLLAELEAVERLIAEGFQPRRTIYLAFGDDEEVGGERGARRIAAVLGARGVQLEYALDEGTPVTDGLLKGIDAPVAIIGTAEKGSTTLEISASAASGHSSMPPAHTAIGDLSAGLVRLQKDSLPAAIDGAAGQMLKTIAPETRGLQRLVLSNLWLFGPLVRRQLEAEPSTNAMVRTTTAMTVLRAGEKSNVLPGSAHALVNFRTLPGQTSRSVLEHARDVLRTESLKVELAPGTTSESSRISTTGTAAYRELSRAIREVFPNAVVTPGLMVGVTDSRYMAEIATDIFRFSPVVAKSSDLDRFHGTNERLSISNYAKMILFYHELLRSSAK